MASRRHTRSHPAAARSADEMTRLGTQAARLGVDLWEAGAKSFIAHQVVVANYKQRMTSIASSALRQSLR
jgi:DNA polymerase IIIc chi subunit